jgi:hypothetical protein
MACSIVDEVESADLGDVRLNKRLKSLVKSLGANPNHSIPAASDSRADWEAAYRFFDNDRVTPEKVLAPHYAATLERVRQCKSVVLVQDTTVVDLTRPNQQVEGAGRLMTESQYGVFYHPLMAFTEKSLALGMAWNKHWTREPAPQGLTTKQKARIRYQTPIEDKESIRWIEGIRAAVGVAQQCPETECICVGDSESDIYETLSELVHISEQNFKLIVRAGQERKTDGQGDWLAAARKSECLFKCSVDVSARRAKFRSKANYNRQADRDARVAEMEVRVCAVTLKPPCRPDRKLPPVTVNLVLCEEPKPPDGCEPIQWLLATNLPITSVDEVQRVLDAYCIRWQIEIFFKTLKSGCRIEERLFEALPRTMNALALYSIVAWRILYLTHLGRECPDLCCEVVFHPSEWKAVYSVANKAKKGKRCLLPKKPPKLNEMIRMIASLGGYIHRPKKDSQPGTKSLWIGLQRAHTMSIAWDTFGPESKKF